jgi:hypothetical protein
MALSGIFFSKSVIFFRNRHCQVLVYVLISIKGFSVRLSMKGANKNLFTTAICRPRGSGAICSQMTKRICKKEHIREVQLFYLLLQD